MKTVKETNSSVTQGFVSPSNPETPYETSSYPVYHELSETPVSFQTLEEEFKSRMALVEDLHKRFHFMVCELQAAGLKTDEI
jgi:hypothetical protein